jgi:hypothetical protein
MFKTTLTPSYSWPVKVRLPADGGKFSEQSFNATFRRLDSDTVRAMYREVTEDEGAAAAVAAVKQVVIGWDGIEDENGPVPFSDTALAELLHIQRVDAAIIAAFFQSCFAMEDKPKNRS